MAFTMLPPCNTPYAPAEMSKGKQLNRAYISLQEIAGTFFVFQNSHGTQLYCVWGAGEIFGLFGRN